jgi:excisionase family DNA binding protein
LTTVYLDPIKAAAYCGVHRETIRRAFRAGALKGWRVGRVLRVTRDDLDAWIAAGGRTTVPRRAFTRAGTTDDNRRPLVSDDDDPTALRRI